MNNFNPKITELASKWWERVLYASEAKKLELLVDLDHLSKFFKYFKMNQKLKFLCFQGIQNSLPSFWAKLGYSQIKIDLLSLHVLYSLQFRIGLRLLKVELTQLLTPCSSEGGWELVGFSELISSSDFHTVSNSNSGIHINWGPTSSNPLPESGGLSSEKYEIQLNI